MGFKIGWRDRRVIPVNRHVDTHPHLADCGFLALDIMEPVDRIACIGRDARRRALRSNVQASDRIGNRKRVRPRGDAYRDESD